METVAGVAGSVWGALLATTRIRQWTKNAFVLAPLLFSRHLFDLDHVILSLAGFLLFSLTASSIYILNDIVDASKDREHPIKKHRPIASGRLPIPIAVAALAAISLGALTASFLINFSFALTLVAYFLLNILYSLYFKEAVIVDVMTIAASFVLRIIAGAFILSVPLSEWLMICTSLLALFLGFSKRRHELSILTEDAAKHRRVLGEYNTYFLDQMISLVTASTLICYILYTLDADTISRFGSKWLIVTCPFVLYGLFRYLYLVHHRKSGGDPTAELLTDKPLIINVLLWAMTFGAIIYWKW